MVKTIAIGDGLSRLKLNWIVVRKIQRRNVAVPQKENDHINLLVIKRKMATAKDQVRGARYHPRNIIDRATKKLVTTRLKMTIYLIILLLKNVKKTLARKITINLPSEGIKNNKTMLLTIEDTFFFINYLTSIICNIFITNFCCLVLFA